MANSGSRASRAARASILLAFLALDACGGKVHAGPAGTGAAPNGGAPAGGTGGGVVSGGTGGGIPAGGAGGIPSGGTSGTCAANCPSYKLAGIIDMPPCCADGAQCGATVTQTLSGLLPLFPGCYGLAQPGKLDSTCPDLQFANPIDGTPVTFPACCRAQTGTCGVRVDLTSEQGPDLGCTAPNGGAGAGSQPCGAPQDCQLCVQNQCASELNACVSSGECLAILECAQACSDQACVDQCVAAHPAGKVGFSAVDACVKYKCGGPCQ